MTKYFALFLAFGVIVSILYGENIYQYSESPTFCNSCHVMNYQYDNFMHNGAHQRIKCVDCHLPNDNIANHLLWKGIDGTKDLVYFYGGIYSDHISISKHGQKVVKENCIACHYEIVSRVEMGGRNCTDCHRRHTHKHTGGF